MAWHWDWLPGPLSVLHGIDSAHQLVIRETFSHIYCATLELLILWFALPAPQLEK